MPSSNLQLRKARLDNSVTADYKILCTSNTKLWRLGVQLTSGLESIYQPDNMTIFNKVTPYVLKGIIAVSAHKIMEEDKVNSFLAQFNRIFNMSQVIIAEMETIHTKRAEW